MAHIRRASLASPLVVRYWALGLFAWGAVLFVAANAASSNPDSADRTAAPALAAPPVSVIPIHVFEETRLRVLRADMTGDFSALLPSNTCGHTPETHLSGATCDPFAGVPGLARNNGPAPPWLAGLPTH
jgi:hypothetical protein